MASQSPSSKPSPPKAAPVAQPLNAQQPVAGQPVAGQPVAAQAAPARQPAGSGQQPNDGQGEAPPEEVTGGSFLMLNAVPSWLVSAVVHAILVLIAALITLPPPKKEKLQLVEMPPVEEKKVEEVEEFEPEEIKDPEFDESKVDLNSEMVLPESEVPQETTIETPANDLDAAAIKVEFVDASEQYAPKNDLAKEIGSVSGTGVSGRGAAARKGMLAKYGGNAASEEAVKAALLWFRAHQLRDGGWSFDHRQAIPCGGKCNHDGKSATARNAATALALLPFLGYGMTHKEGEFKKNVAAGLRYLATHGKPKSGGYSWEESGGNMYSHGLCAITLCEAYAMTHDKQLMGPAQASLNYIAYAQDPVGGGWRYSARQPGDTSVVGWQLMALKSGHMGYLMVRPNTVRGAVKFLDSVQSNSGAQYGYTNSGAGTATSAVGLLCRMYLGWKQDHPALERGVQIISNRGPSLRESGNRLSGNMYYNYYATQVMKHYEGEMWNKWNLKTRDTLVKHQSKVGHMTGSWFLDGDHGANAGGRLYCTSMATMILEVYYRHMPIYQKQASEEEFPL